MTPAATTNAPWTDPDGTFHEIYTGYLFVGSDLLGELTYDSGRRDLGWHRCSYAMFCPHCGEIWARLVMHNSRGEQCYFEVQRVSCERHPDWWNVPGSMLVGHLEHLLADLPPDAVKREFAIHLNYKGVSHA